MGKVSVQELGWRLAGVGSVVFFFSLSQGWRAQPTGLRRAAFAPYLPEVSGSLCPTPDPPGCQRSYPRASPFRLRGKGHQDLEAKESNSGVSLC